MAALTILNPPGPKVEYFINLNILYLILDMNLHCPDTDFTSIKIGVIEWEDFEGEISSGSNSYFVPAWQLTKRTQEEGIPDYNLNIDLKNKIYTVQFTFVFEYFDNLDGEIEFYSEPTEIIIDNRNPIITSRISSDKIRSYLLRTMETRNDFTIFYNTELQLGNYKVGDITVTNRLRKKVITDIQNNLPVFGSVDTDTLSFIDYLLENEQLKDILNNLIPTGVNPEHTVMFICEYNKNRYTCYLRGDLTDLKN
jgi:hypothetical protein